MLFRSAIAACVSPAVVLAMQLAAGRVHVADVIADYATRIVRATRSAAGVAFGASPRAAVGLVRAARARAATHGRDFVLPDDIQALAIPVLAHRIIATADAVMRARTTADVLADLLREVPVPVAGPA